MGLLKHAILPVWCLLHAYVVYLMVVRKDIKAAIELFDWPAKEGDSQDLTLWEQHCFGIITGAHAAFLFGCIVGIFHEHSHFRAMIAAMELIFWSVGGYDAFNLGMPCAFAYVMAAFSVVGLIAHSREPGLFTVDKKKGKPKSG